MTNTALSAKAKQIAQNVTFRDDEHKKFFLTYLPKCRYGDVYHVALVYCLGVDADTRRKKMKHKKAAAALSAAVAGASVLAGIRSAAGKRKSKKGREPDLQEEVLTEGKPRECLLRLYEDSEFDDSAEFLGDGGDPREYEAENYSSQLFPYIKRNMTDVLFCYPACKIGCEIRELFWDNFVLCLQSEMWILENGEFASVYYVSIGKDGERLSYRFVDSYIKNPGDIPICFEDLESGFAEIIEAEKEGREPYLP